MLERVLNPRVSVNSTSGVLRRGEKSTRRKMCELKGKDWNDGLQDKNFPQPPERGGRYAMILNVTSRSNDPGLHLHVGLAASISVKS